MTRSSLAAKAVGDFCLFRRVDKTVHSILDLGVEQFDLGIHNLAGLSLGSVSNLRIREASTEETVAVSGR